LYGIRWELSKIVRILYLCAKRDGAMVLDKDIYRTATGLIKIHGLEAATECAQMAERWEKRGDDVAAQVWRRVSLAVQDIEQREPRTPSETDAA
jgi:hypothetical protein